MNTAVPSYRFKSPALYNPRLWDANEVRAYYVARPGGRPSRLAIA